MNLATGTTIVQFDRDLQPGSPDASNWQIHADGEVWNALPGGIIFNGSVTMDFVRSGIPSALQVIDYFGTGTPIRDLAGTPAPVQTDVPLTVI